MPLPDLDILVAIAESGSLTAAAEELKLPRPTLSRHLSRLEEEVGAVLVHRSPRRTILTDAGEELYRHARPIVEAVHSATGAIRARDGIPRGLLRVSVPGADTILTEMMSAYAKEYPLVRLEVVAVARHVDLVGEGFDVALRAGQLRDEGLIARSVGHSRIVAVASPDYLALRGCPSSPAELSEHDCLVGFDRGEAPSGRWPLLAGGFTEVSPRIACNEPRMLLDAALRGLGIALLPDLFVDAHLKAGALTRVLVEDVGASGGLWIVYPEKRLMLPRVRAFIDHVVTWMATHPLRSASDLGG